MAGPASRINNSAADSAIFLPMNGGNRSRESSAEASPIHAEDQGIFSQPLTCYFSDLSSGTYVNNDVENHCLLLMGDIVIIIIYAGYYV